MRRNNLRDVILDVGAALVLLACLYGLLGLVEVAR